jgi:hypothetical protein
LKKQGNATVLRLLGTRYEDLELVAEALYRHFWEETATNKKNALIRSGDALRTKVYLDGLRDLRSRLIEIELSLSRRDGGRLWSLDLSERPQLPQLGSGPSSVLADDGGVFTTRTGALKLCLLSSPEDRNFRDELINFLSSLERQNLIEHWHGGRSLAGTSFSELANQITESRIILLLISQDFLNSAESMKLADLACQLNRAGGRLLIPILVRTTMEWKQIFGEFAVLPKGGIPVSRSPDRDQIWTEIVLETKLAIMALMRKLAGNLH